MNDQCIECGLQVRDGTEGCRRMVEELWARDYSDARYFRSHRLLVDTYCLQHPNRYCASAKSLAAHLGGLCCALEHPGNPAALRALQRWLSGAAPLTRPELPTSRGELTVADVYGTLDPESHARAVDRWARATWAAYAPLQPLARSCIQRALGA